MANEVASDFGCDLDLYEMIRYLLDCFAGDQEVIVIINGAEPAFLAQAVALIVAETVHIESKGRELTKLCILDLEKIRDVCNGVLWETHGYGLS